MTEKNILKNIDFFLFINKIYVQKIIKFINIKLIANYKKIWKKYLIHFFL